jgi:branched-chain amino acid transport system permease protein
MMPIFSEENMRKVLIALFVFYIFLYPLLVQDNYSLNIMIFVGINAIIVIGLGLLLGYAGQISLGHAAFYGLGAYISGYLTTKYPLSVWLTIPISMFFTGVLAYFIALPTLKLKGHYLAMATLGFGEIMSVLFVELDEFTGGTSGMTNIPSPKIFNYTLDSYQNYYYLTWIIVFLVFLLSVNIVRSRVGRALLAIHGSEHAAEASGVDVFKYKIQIFVLSAVYAALAGGLYAHFVNFISPSNFTLLYSIILVIMVIVGGMSRLWGAVVGAIILTALPEYMRMFKEYNLLIFSILLILTMLFMPKGVASAFEERLKNFKLRLKGESYK